MRQTTDQLRHRTPDPLPGPMHIPIADPTGPNGDQLGPERGRTHAQFALGVLAGIGMVAVWGSWAAITRKGALEIDLPVLVLVRFLVPALIFLPVTLRVGLVPADVSPGQLVLIVAGSGIGAFLCAAFSLWLAPVAEVAPLMPAAPPLMVALYMALWHGHKFRSIQIAGLILITAGIAIVVGWRMWQSHEILAGHILALLGALLWAAYTVAFRRSRLSALECAAVVSAWSAFVAVPFGITFLIDEWQAGRQAEILAQVAMQGVGSGVIAVLLYGICVRTLGAPEAAAMVALSSVVSVALAVPLLGEIPEWTAIIGIVAMTAGVVFTNWREPKEKVEDEEAATTRQTMRETMREPWDNRDAKNWDADQPEPLRQPWEHTTREQEMRPAPPRTSGEPQLPDWLARPTRG